MHVTKFRLICSLVFTFFLAEGASAQGGSLPLAGGGGSLPLRTMGHAVTVESRAEDTTEISTEVDVTLIEDELAPESSDCPAGMRAWAAQGSLKLGRHLYAIQTLCFDTATQNIVIIAIREIEGQTETATLRATLSATHEKLRRLTGRLTISDTHWETRRYMVESTEQEGSVTSAN